ncbi:MAG: Zn-dependent hydrolase, partial [Lachnospiraceae bacterium]|nr:Zn-dependent hydrolase [Lachnospiraceae bacterium]
MEANKTHLKEMIETLFSISEPCEAGVQRQSYSTAYRQGVDYVRKKMAEIGLDSREDTVGNVFGTLKGTDASLPCIMSGSHLDTVRCAGGFDGIAGVVCAME